MAADLYVDDGEGKQARVPRKRQAVLDAARRVFTEKGYNASMEEIAFEAEVSKQTIYNQFGSKEQLFLAMVDARVEEMLAPVVEAAADADPHGVLTEIGRAYHRKVIGPDNVKLLRAVIAAPSAANILRNLYSEGPSRFTRVFATWLAAQDATGRLRIPDPILAAEHFVSFTIGPLHMRRLFGVDTPLNDADIERRVSYCVESFLKAHAP
ncbi:MAG: TetR/AcrR family transcriptional regulator [Alphaproteobacteria bacterium]|nr:TetR/AcrR family transcriptional regulator [Alphaproteobacteria bacterium]